MRNLVAAASALALVGAAGIASADVTMGPAVAPHAPGHVSVMWQSTNASAQEVTFQSPGRPDVRATTRVENGVHRAEVSGLTPGVEYTYQVEGRTARFMSPPDASQDLRFAVFGDTRTGDNVHRQIVQRVVQLRPDFAMTTGDLLPSGSNMSQWRTFFDIERPLLESMPFSSARGNHDVGSPLFEQLVQLRSQTEGATSLWGSMNIGPAHFLMVDTESSLAPGSPQLAFVERDLEANRTRPTFVFLHKPLFSTGSHGGAKFPEVRDNLGPLFQRFGVDVVFQGHDHHYQRTSPINGVTYMVTGGGGAPLRGTAPAPWSVVAASVHHFVMVEASATRVRVTATNVDGSQLDQFELDPRANNGQFTGSEPMPDGGSGGAPFVCSITPTRMAHTPAAPAVLAAGLGLTAVLARRIRRRRARATARKA